MTDLSLKKYIAKRIAVAIPLIFIVIVLCFTLIHLAPGNPVMLLAGDMSSEEYVHEMTIKYGLDKPIYEQLYIYISKMFTGDFGYSLFYKEPVLQVVLEILPNTLILMAAAMIFAIIIGIPLGVQAAKHSGTIWDNAIMTLCLAGYSVPVFWLGLLGLLVFSTYLGWFPSFGMVTIGATLNGVGYVIDLLRHLVLPAVCLEQSSWPC